MPRTPLLSARFFSRLVDATRCRLAAPEIALDQVEAAAVARDVAQQLMTEFAGCEIYVPIRKADRRSKRNAQICQQYRQPGPGGVPARCVERSAQLAVEHGLSVRTVRSILARAL